MRKRVRNVYILDWAPMIKKQVHINRLNAKKNNRFNYNKVSINTDVICHQVDL